MSSPDCDSLLLDTHITIWMTNEPERLPPSLLAAIERAKDRFVSHVTAWEIQIKSEKHAAAFTFSLDKLERTMKAFSCKELPIEYRDIEKLSQMRFLHQDPFDRMLMSQAANRSIHLVTLDEQIVRTFELERAFPLFTDRPHAARRKLRG